VPDCAVELDTGAKWLSHRMREHVERHLTVPIHCVFPEECKMGPGHHFPRFRNLTNHITKVGIPHPFTALTPLTPIQGHKIGVESLDGDQLEAYQRTKQSVKEGVTALLDECFPLLPEEGEGEESETGTVASSQQGGKLSAQKSEGRHRQEEEGDTDSAAEVEVDGTSANEEVEGGGVVEMEQDGAEEQQEDFHLRDSSSSSDE
jgi:hypothetical protein